MLVVGILEGVATAISVPPFGSAGGNELPRWDAKASLHDEKLSRVSIISALSGIPNSIPLFKMSSVADIRRECCVYHSHAVCVTGKCTFGSSGGSCGRADVAWLVSATVTRVLAGSSKMTLSSSTCSSYLLLATPSAHSFTFLIDDGISGVAVEIDMTLVAAVLGISATATSQTSTTQHRRQVESLVGKCFVFSMSNVAPPTAPAACLRVDSVGIVNVARTFRNMLSDLTCSDQCFSVT